MHVDKKFLQDLGSRIAARRKELGITQAELADSLQCSQQSVAQYESGTRRLPVSLLPELSRILGLTLDELLGTRSAPKQKKRGPPSKLEKQLEAIAALPRAKQRFVSDMLETMLESAQR